MDYTIGSVADLITGKNTPNKPKVAKKEIAKIEGVAEEDYSNSPISHKLKKKKKIDILKLHNENPIVGTNQNLKDKKKHKKKGNNGVDTTGGLVKEEGRKQNKAPRLEEELNTKIKKKKINISEVDAATSKDINEGSIKKKRKALKKDEIDSASNSGVQNDTLPLKRKHTPSDDNEASPNKHSRPNTYSDNALRRIEQKKKNELRKSYDIDNKLRTIFVGNVPISMNKKALKNIFKKYGPIESIRFRGVPVADPRVPKKVAAIHKQFHPNRSSKLSYIRFVNPEDAANAEAEDGTIIENHHIRVRNCERKEKPDETKAIFVGNLSFDAEEDDLWELFKECGKITSVRIVRDSLTGMGKGFAFVNFADSDAVQLALEMENVEFRNRALRIKLCDLPGAKKKRKTASEPLRKQSFKKKRKVDKSQIEKKKKAKKIAPFSGP